MNIVFINNYLGSPIYSVFYLGILFDEYMAYFSLIIFGLGFEVRI